MSGPAVAALLAAVTVGGVDTPETQRWEVHSTVVLPRPVWLIQGVQGTVRATEVELDLSLACREDPDDDREVSCLIEDVAIRAAAMPGDEVLMAGAVKEADERLTGAIVQLQVKKGRIRNVGLDVVQTGPRLRRMIRMRDENLRLFLSRALSGFDLQTHELTVGRDGDEDTVWHQRNTWLVQMPAGRGTHAVGHVVHQARPQDDGRFQVLSQSDFSIAVEVLNANGVPAAQDTFRGEMRAEAYVGADGGLLSRRWALHAEPTPSADVANGLVGLPYIQTGRLVRLEGDTRAELGKSGVISPNHRQPTALQSDKFLGVPLGAFR